MGREIRRVPKGWQHPRKDGRYIAMFDETYEEAAERWIENFLAWENGDDPDREKYDTRYFWDWDGGPPDKSVYRPAFDGEPVCFQIYETVSEGTPVSPVFETEDDIVAWLLEKGYTEIAARKFVEHKHAFSMMFRFDVGLIPGIQANDPDAVKSGEMHTNFLNE